MQHHQNGYTDEAAAFAQGEGWDELDGATDELEGAEAMEDDALEAGAADGMEEDVLEEDAAADELGADAAEDEASDDDAFEEGPPAELLAAGEDEALEEDQAVEGGFDLADELAGEAEGAESWEGESFAEDEGEAVDSIFVESLDSADEDEFIRRLLARALQGGGRLAARLPTAQEPWQLAGQIVSRLPLPHASELGGIVSTAGPHAQHAAPYLEGWARRIDPSLPDHMDFYADAMTDYASAGADLEAFVAPLSGFASRYAVKATVPPGARARKRVAVKALAKATRKAVEKSTRVLLRELGPAGALAAPAVVRRAVKLVRARKARPSALPALIQRTAARVVRNKVVARKLARPSRRVRALRRRAGIRPGASVRGYAPTQVRSYRRPRTRTLRLRGPVVIRYRR